MTAIGTDVRDDEGAVPCDGNDNPPRQAILYGVDTRAERQVEQDAQIGLHETLGRGRSALSNQALGRPSRALVDYVP